MSASKITIPEASVDPVASATGVQLYVKDVSGIKQAFLRASDGTISQVTPVGGDGSSPSASPYSGSGLDGAHHFDGVATILGVAPATYIGVPNTYHFTRDLNLDDGTIIDSGVTVLVEDSRFFCRGTCTNNGRISNNGRKGVGRIGGSGSQSYFYPAGNGAAGNGSNTGGGGGAGTASSNAVGVWSNQAASAPGVAGAGHGQGGGGGNSGDGQIGGTGGAITIDTADLQSLDILELILGKAGRTYGSGGGGGAVTGTAFASQGGGGGAGGNWFFVGIDTIAGTGAISTDGGDGAAGVTNGGEPTVACGGGGGGGGGILGVAFGENSGPNTFTANGGVGGAAGSGGGAPGGSGSAGSVVEFPMPLIATPSGGPSLAWFGDGSDGNVTISGPTTLTRDMFYNNLTVNTGVVLSTGGYRIFVFDTLTLSGTAKIERNGENGADAVFGGASPGAGGQGHSFTGLGTLYNQTGSGGGGGVGAGANGTGTAGFRGIGNAGAGGAGGFWGATTGGSASQPPSADFGDIRSLPQAVLGRSFGQGNFQGGQVAPGGGGGGGSQFTSQSTGGGGGAGAGWAVVCAKTLAGSGTIEAKGGHGGNGADAPLSYGTDGGGGGGGGSGGIVTVVYSTGTPNTVVTGGTGGLKSNANATDGSPGAAGFTLLFQV